MGGSPFPPCRNCGCPICGTKGEHISVEVYWATRTASVRHRCPNKVDHPFGYEFEEDARDPMGAVRAALGIKDGDAQ